MAASLDKGIVEEISGILGEFTQMNLPNHGGTVSGPIQEGSSYRWSVISTRYKNITVVLKTRKPLFSQPTPVSIEVYGSTGKRKLQPNAQDLRKFLETAELVPTS